MNNNNKAFSLIELSIVLIIIGLLVAGITGGQSLIESAKIKGFMNEMDGYKQAVFAFKTIKDRLPGDINNDGKIGPIENKENYNSSSFKYPYNGKNPNYRIPNDYTGPFVEMYIEGIINNEIKKETYVYSNILKDSIYYFEVARPVTKNQYVRENMKIGSIYLTIKGWDETKKKPLIPIKYFVKFDNKFDDGIYNNGIFRGACGVDDDNNQNFAQNYENTMKKNQDCFIGYYHIID